MDTKYEAAFTCGWHAALWYLSVLIWASRPHLIHLQNVFASFNPRKFSNSIKANRIIQKARELFWWMIPIECRSAALTPVGVIHWQKHQRRRLPKSATWWSHPNEACVRGKNRPSAARAATAAHQQHNICCFFAGISWPTASPEGKCVTVLGRWLLHNEATSWQQPLPLHQKGNHGDLLSK